MIIKINPQKINRKFVEGYALDKNIISSTFLGYDEYERKKFDTKRTDIGEALYRVKYGEKNGIKIEERQKYLIDIIDTGIYFLKNKWLLHELAINLIIPVPSTKKYRNIRHVHEIANNISKHFNIPFQDNILTNSSEVSLKDTEQYDEKVNILDKHLKINTNICLQNKTILIVDDFCHSGATLDTITKKLLDYNAKKIYAFTITKRWKKTK